MNLKTIAVAFGISAVTLCVPAHAGPIGSGAFLAPVVDDFTGLGLPFNNSGSLVRPEGTYTTDTNSYRYADFGSYSFGQSIGNNTDTGWIDVVFNTPSVRAGGWVGASASSVQFFGVGNILLGTLTTTLDQPPQFVGWEDFGGITRIRFGDTDGDSQIIVLDRVTVEGAVVPQPGVLALLALGFGALRLRRSKSA